MNNMEYTEKEKRAIENIKIILNSNIRNPFLDDEADSIDILLNLIEKQNKEIARLDGQNVVINHMRSGKNLLSRIATDYAESTLRVFELQSVSGYTIDFIIDLFKRGFVLVNEEKIKRLKGIEEDYIRRMKTSNKVLLKQGYVPIEKYNELLNSKVGVDLVYDDYISKEAIREKIKAKELQKEFAETIDDRIHLDGEIYILKELLGE